MPVYYPSSLRKPIGFSIDDIIKSNDLSKPSDRFSSSYLPPMTWLPSLPNTYQLQRESMLQYLRHINQLTRRFLCVPFILKKKIPFFF
jgi:hypothetical protein